jgi:hypothetical protein
MRALSPYNALRRHNEASRRSRPRGALVATILKVRRNATEQDKLLHPRVSFCHGCDSSRRRVASTPRGLVDAQEPHCVLQSAAARFENWMVPLEPVWARIADCLWLCEFEAGTASVEDKRMAGREGGRTGGRAGDVEDKRKAGRAGDAEAKRKAGREGGESSGMSRTAAARRRHGQDDDAVISPTTSIPGRASVRDRIDRAKGRAVRLAIQLNLYTTRSLKRDETAGYVRLVRASGENDPDTVMCDAECDGLENDRSPMDSDTYARHPVDDFSD